VALQGVAQQQTRNAQSTSYYWSRREKPGASNRILPARKGPSLDQTFPPWSSCQHRYSPAGSCCSHLQERRQLSNGEENPFSNQMSKGFGAKQQTKEQYIKNFIKSSKALRNGFATPEEAKLNQSRTWFNQYIKNETRSSREQLLTPKVQPLTICSNYKPPGLDCSNIILAGFNGQWRVLIFERQDKSLDFDIAVWAGCNYRFHSEVIKQSIISKHGTETYNIWRNMVKADIDSLRELIKVMSSQVDSVPWSYTCSISAARLCQQVGISTYRGAAFLFPPTYR